MESFELKAKRLAHPRRVVRQRPIAKLDDGGA